MKKLLFALLALPMILAACGEQKDTPTPKPIEPTLTLTSASEVEFAAEGGEGTITYNYKAGDIVNNDEITGDIATLKIACDAEWITIESEVAPLGEISYVVAKNETTEARETIITAALNELSFSVTIKQLAGTVTPEPEPEPTIKGWAIVGTMNNWDASKAIAMDSIDGYHVIKATKLTTDDRFKFIKDGDNAQNRGGNGLNAEPNYLYNATLWGSDIHVSKEGTYDIYLNAKADTYYIMDEGKSPEEAIAPIAPDEDLYEVYGDIEGDRVRLISDRRYMIAKGIKFTKSEAMFSVSINNNEVVYGAESSANYNVGEEIAISSNSTNQICVNVEVGVSYDICFRSDRESVWVMPTGELPLFWKSVTGVAFSSTNFAIFLESEDLDLYFDFNCATPAQNNIIPEGTYYVDSENDGGNNFNLESEYHMRIEGIKTILRDGTMVIKHIPGGYDITVDVSSIHNHKVNVRYTGPIGEQPMMGRPITNPE